MGQPKAVRDPWLISSTAAPHAGAWSDAGPGRRPGLRGPRTRTDSVTTHRDSSNPKDGAQNAMTLPQFMSWNGAGHPHVASLEATRVPRQGVIDACHAQQPQDSALELAQLSHQGGLWTLAHSQRVTLHVLEQVDHRAIRWPTTFATLGVQRQAGDRLAFRGGKVVPGGESGVSGVRSGPFRPSAYSPRLPPGEMPRPNRRGAWTSMWSQGPRGCVRSEQIKPNPGQRRAIDSLSAASKKWPRRCMRRGHGSSNGG